MSQLFPFLLLAAADVFDPLEENPLPPQSSGGLFSSHLRDLLLVIGAAIVMALILFLWAYLTRKDRQRHAASARGTRLVSRSSRHHSSKHSGPHRRIRRRRRSHSDNLPRNPTLAEAGGLPPLRPEEPEPAPEAEAEGSEGAAPTPPQAQPQ